MRHAMLLLVAVLTGCGREPDFDQRYASTERRIADRAADMERALEAGAGGEGDTGTVENGSDVSPPGPSPESVTRSAR